LVVAIQLWCQQFDCAMPSFDVLGGIRGKTTAGKTVFELLIAAAAGAASGACAAALGALDPLASKQTIVGRCPKPPQPDRGKGDEDKCKQFSDDFDPVDFLPSSDQDDNTGESPMPPDPNTGAVVGRTTAQEIRDRNPPSAPSDPAPPPRGTNPPPSGGPWEWRGKPSGVGGSEGNWFNPETSEAWFRDKSSPSYGGEHWDYRDKNGLEWRYKSDGTWELKHHEKNLKRLKEMRCE
ncbi:MAG: hypothetical protein QOF73_3827, partial [Thermomicrobiales bacterium]|nr:hypothetical protein [Thermomicrobiales bacterium]